MRASDEDELEHLHAADPRVNACLPERVARHLGDDIKLELWHQPRQHDGHVLIRRCARKRLAPPVYGDLIDVDVVEAAVGGLASQDPAAPVPCQSWKGLWFRSHNSCSR